MSSVEVLVGTIASGKSTYCKRRAKEGAVIINDDSIVEAIHAGDYTLYDKKLKPLYKSVEVAIFSSAVLLGRDIVIDRGLSLTVHSRKRWIGLAKSFDYACLARIFKFDLPYEHARRRFNSDSRGLDFIYWWNVALQHTSVYERPSIDEGFDYIFTNNLVADVVEMMLKYCKHPNWDILAKAMKKLEANFIKRVE